ncbi:unnamed protein product, partial [Symbiodinium microadriaticum]
DTRWLTRDELKEAMKGSGEMPLWSPWFKIINERLLDAWRIWTMLFRQTSTSMSPLSIVSTRRRSSTVGSAKRGLGWTRWP